ncbi:MAG: lipocalin family protein [Opitutales bacterium]|nr:lipocalin family protein [Opitutales bacterium]
MKIQVFSLSILALLAVAGCSNEREPNKKLADYVDLDRLMGIWYVQGYTPTTIDKNAWNPTETYEMRDDGKIQTIYQFREGSAYGKVKTYKPVGTIKNTETNAEWRMQFFGVINAAYYVVYVSDNYQECIIGHPNKKYAWTMTRSKSIDKPSYENLLQELKARNYDLDRFRRAQHEW